CVALACTFLNQFAVRAQRALHADEILLHILTIRISAARCELAVAPMPDHQVAPAFWAKLIERNVWNFLALIQAAGSLAIRISRARHELPEAAAFKYHHSTAVFAVLVSRSSFLHVGRIKIWQIDGIFFGKRAAIRIIFVIRAARVK